MRSTGGGCFPLHTDHDAAAAAAQATATHRADPHRLLSAVLYLNPDWTPSDGGEVVLYPFPSALPPYPYSNSTSQQLKQALRTSGIPIAPLLGRVVLFSSLHSIHRVLPTAPHFHRFCLTLWFSGTRRSPQPLAALSPPPLATATDSQVLQYLLHPLHRTALCKLLYAEEWADSLQQSHAPSAQRQAVIDKHWADVQLIARFFREYSDFVLPLQHIAVGPYAQNSLPAAESAAVQHMRKLLADTPLEWL